MMTKKILGISVTNRFINSMGGGHYIHVQSSIKMFVYNSVAYNVGFFAQLNLNIYLVKLKWHFLQVLSRKKRRKKD